MDQKPFRSLDSRRTVGRADLPPDLARFYETHEGVGLESGPRRSIRLCRLDEIEERAWGDVPIFGGDDLPGWNDFRGISIGVGLFLDGVYWVRKAPCCPVGSILAFGPDVSGPGGAGDRAIEGTLVLASSFDGWLDHLARHDWFEYGLAPGNIWDEPEPERAGLLAYYRALNPGIRWEPL